MFAARRPRNAPGRAVWLIALWLAPAAYGEEAREEGGNSPTEAANAQTEEAPPLGPDWAGRVDFSFASSSGNAEARSAGIGARAAREVSGFRLTLDGALLRASTGKVVREAVGSPEDFEVLRSVSSQVSADRTHLRAEVSEAGGAASGPGIHYFGAAGWERDGPAGLKRRMEMTAGMQARFGEETGLTSPVEIGAGLSLTNQVDEVRDAEAAATSLGLRVDWKSSGRIGDAEAALAAASTWNLGTRDDLRLDVTGSVAMALTSRLAFRSSLQVLYDTRPALERVPLAMTENGPETGTVLVPRGRVDAILLTTLAWRFGE